MSGRRTYVYFILVLSGDPIVKIGVAYSPQRRLEELQTACPYELVLMGRIPGGYALEREIHDDLSEDRVRGEWFWVTERTDKWLAKMQKTVKRSSQSAVKKVRRAHAEIRKDGPGKYCVHDPYSGTVWGVYVTKWLAEAAKREFHHKGVGEAWAKKHGVSR